MPREKELKKRSKPHRQRSAKPQRVLKYAALGKSSKLARLFTESLLSDLGLFDSEGNTALHLAAHHGHKDTAALLVRCAYVALLCGSRVTRRCDAHLGLLCRQGADCKAENFAGNTPAHLAAMHGHAAILTLLLQVRGAICRALASSPPRCHPCHLHSASTELGMHLPHHLCVHQCRADTAIIRAQCSTAALQRIHGHARSRLAQRLSACVSRQSRLQILRPPTMPAFPLPS